MKRRNFLISSILGAPALASEVSPLQLLNYKPGKKSKSDLKISFQDGIAPGRNLEERFDYMEEYGIEGFEPRGIEIITDFNRYQNLLKYRNIKISAVQSGYKGFILSCNQAVAHEYKSIIREIIAAAGDLAATGVIFAPATMEPVRRESDTSELYKYAIDQLYDLAGYAEMHNTSVILKPLRRKETNWINTVSGASEICRLVNRKGLRCMGDFWHMTGENISDLDDIVSGGEYLCHFHIASRKTRCLPGSDGPADNYINGFTGLKKIKYRGFISYDCSINGNKSLIVPESVNLLLQQWQSC